MVTIQELDHHNLPDAGQCDGLFTIDARLAISADNGIIHYTIIEVNPPTQKRDQLDEIDYRNYIGNKDRIVYLAYLDG